MKGYTLTEMMIALTIIGILSGGGGSPAVVQQAPGQAPPANDKGAAFVATCLAAILPARKVSRMPVVDALRQGV